ncbi:hypothetical protein Tco_0255036 [Tanacetum coccineum]
MYGFNSIDETLRKEAEGRQAVKEVLPRVIRVFLRTLLMAASNKKPEPSQNSELRLESIQVQVRLFSLQNTWLLYYYKHACVTISKKANLACPLIIWLFAFVKRRSFGSNHKKLSLPSCNPSTSKSQAKPSLFAYPELTPLASAATSAVRLPTLSYPLQQEPKLGRFKKESLKSYLSSASKPPEVGNQRSAICMTDGLVYGLGGVSCYGDGGDDVGEDGVV